MFDLEGYTIRGRFGVFSFIDNGKVWAKNENSGGGIFLALYNTYSFNLFYAASNESSMSTLRAGFLL